MSEIDPFGKKPTDPGVKLDGGKVPVAKGLRTQFPRACEAVARVSHKGAMKYTWGGWQTVDPERFADAQERHEIKLAKGELIDDGVGGIDEPHLAQVAWNSMCRLELWLRDQELQKNAAVADPMVVTAAPANGRKKKKWQRRKAKSKRASKRS